MYELDDSEVEEDLKLIRNKVIIISMTEIQKVKCYSLENNIIYYYNGDTNNDYD